MDKGGDTGCRAKNALESVLLFFLIHDPFSVLVVNPTGAQVVHLLDLNKQSGLLPIKLFNNFGTYPRVIRPEAAIRHYIKQQLVEVVGVWSDNHPGAVRMCLGWWIHPFDHATQCAVHRSGWGVPSDMGSQLCPGILQSVILVKSWLVVFSHRHALLLVGHFWWYH